LQLTLEALVISPFMLHFTIASICSCLETTIF